MKDGEFERICGGYGKIKDESGEFCEKIKGLGKDLSG